MTNQVQTRIDPAPAMHTPDADAAPALEAVLDAARKRIAERQQAAGHWHYELEADCTIPAEYILMLHYLGEREPALERKLANYLRAHQLADGGWPLYHGGSMDVSCSAKAYFALKLTGDRADARHMQRACTAIRQAGGAARSNVFTRITLALYGELPWRGVPLVPVEIMLLPHWFPVSLRRVSYWSRTVTVPLAVLCSLKPRAANPGDVHVNELFTTPPDEEKHYFQADSGLSRLFLACDRLGHWLEPLIPAPLRCRALRRAEHWIIERLNGTSGLGAIFPAMVNAYEALGLLGYAADHPCRQQARQALRGLLVVREKDAYCQPCLSPVWDTGLTCLALEEDGGAPQAVNRALEWLRERQLLEAPGDWRETHPHLAGGGWPFQFHNDYYPDLDDTAVNAWAMHDAPAGGRQHYARAIDRAADWLVGMQSKNGGFAAFDADNDSRFLNQVPFADHGALLDPPTSDVTARVATLLARLDRAADRAALQRALAFLRRTQESTGCWFGRWGTNYIYGTWSALTALTSVNRERDAVAIQRATDWLLACQNADGGWGETNDSYFDPQHAGTGNVSTACQTAWALLGLMAAGAVDHPATARGIDFLLRTQQNGVWSDPSFNAPGFPRVFYLKYHAYSQTFPFWALARYRNTCAGRHA